jgi:hypothetical protein
MVIAATVLGPGACASAVEPFLATALLAAAMAAVLVVRACGARIEVPHDDVSLKTIDMIRIGPLLSKHLADMSTIYR